MPKLNEYIGMLLSEMVKARVTADLETVRVAELYASHPLLKNMPLPHMRLPEIKLDIPIAIKDVDKTASPVYNFPKMKEVFTGIYTAQIKKENLTITAEEKETLDKRIEAVIKELGSGSTLPPTVDYIAEKFTSQLTTEESQAARKTVKSKTDFTKFAKISDSIKAELIKELPKHIEIPEAGIDVIVTANELRDAVEKDKLTVINLSVTEDGYMWNTITKDDGNTENKLLPE